MENDDRNKYGASELSQFLFMGSNMKSMIEKSESLPIQPLFIASEALPDINVAEKGKLPIMETATNLPVYPQRPRERYCDNYMTTKTCKFGARCIFDHPLWVPEGGIKDYKEVPRNSRRVSYSERCKDRDSPIQRNTAKSFSFVSELNQPSVTFAPKQAHNSNELPIRLGKEDCLGYIVNGSCMFGIHCQFNHPKTINPPLAIASAKRTIQPMVTFGERNEIFGSNTHFDHHESSLLPSAGAWPIAMIRSGEAFNLPSYDLQNMDLHSAIASLEVEQAIHPQLPGEINCNIFGEMRMFQRPASCLSPRTVAASQALWPSVKPSLSVLPRKEGTAACNDYMNTGFCMSGFACQFDHPPPREVLAMARAQDGAAGSVAVTQTAAFVVHGTVACDYYMNTGVCEFGLACKSYHPPPKEVIAMARAQEGATESVGETEAASSTVEEEEDTAEASNEQK